MLYAYDDEDNAPMIDPVETNYTLVWKTLEELGFTKEEAKRIRKEKEQYG